MSTKIYNGMRVKLTDFERFIEEFRKESIKAIKKEVDELITDYSEDKCAESLKKYYNEDCPKEFAVTVLLMHYMIRASKTSENYLNFDTWFNAWIVGEYVYIYAPYDRYVPTYKNFSDLCVDFSYWDNSDPDQNASEEDWANREEIWDKLMDYSGKESQKLSYIVMEAKNVTDKGILQVFPESGTDKIYSLHSIAYFMEKNDKEVQ